MPNSISAGFGSDATQLAAWGVYANERLGKLDVIVENIGANPLYLQVKSYTGTGIVNNPNGTVTTTTSASGYVNVGNAFSVAPGGASTQSYIIDGKQVGFFGSGNTSANITTVLRNTSDLRGEALDMASNWHFGWGFDPGTNIKSFRSPGWGAFPFDSTVPQL